MMRYPGGSYGDRYNWQDNTAPGGYVAPGTDFDSFMGTVKAVGAQPILIANYGSGTPQEAADWVQYANVTKGYGDKYWEIGNEIYGNGYYGADWETDNHASKSPADLCRQRHPVRQRDEGGRPDDQDRRGADAAGQLAGQRGRRRRQRDWNQTVLSDRGLVDRLRHRALVPERQRRGDALLQTRSSCPGELAQLRQEIDQYAGRERPEHRHRDDRDRLQRLYEDTQPDALFAADTYFTALENGVVHGGLVGHPQRLDRDHHRPRRRDRLSATTGVFSSGSCVGNVCEPAVNTPFPTYYAISMLSKLAQPGDTMVNAGIGQATGRPCTRSGSANGDLSRRAGQQGPAATPTRSTCTTPAGTPSSATPTVYTYGDEATSITQAQQGRQRHAGRSRRTRS